MSKKLYNKMLVVVFIIGAITALTGGVMYLFDGFFNLDNKINYPAFVMGESGLIILMIVPIAKGVELVIEIWNDLSA